MDWQQIWPVVAFGVAQLLALAKAYHGLKADNAKIAADLAIAMLTEKGERMHSVSEVKNEMQSLLNKLEGYVTELTTRVMKLESGQDEWTKSLRQRTHELANDLQTLILKVDRLERPGPSEPR